MCPKPSWVLSLLLLSPVLSLAAPPPPHVGLAWYWHAPQGAPPPEWHLLLVDTQAGDTTQHEAALEILSDSECRALVPEGYTAPPDWCRKASCPAGVTWCGRLTCPAPGAYTAVLQQGASLPTNPVSFGITADPGRCTLTGYTQALERPQTPGAPRPTALPAEASPTSTALPMAFTLTEDEIGAVTQEMTALDTEFSVLDATYQTELTAITDAYQQALEEARVQAQRGAQAQVEQAWIRARELQTQAYERTTAYWEQLHALWQDWLTRVQARALAHPTPAATLGGEPHVPSPASP